MNKLIIALDPGGTTGYCIFKIIEGRATLFRYGQFTTFTGLPYLEQEIKSYGGNVDIVYEDFILVKVNIHLDAIKTIGAIQYWYAANHQEDRTQVTLNKQTPSERTFVEYRFTKPYKHVTDHRRSAMLHAMAFIYKKYKITDFDLETRGVEI